MFKNFLHSLFGTSNERYIKRFRPLVDSINQLEPQLEALSDDALKARTQWFKERFLQGETLDNLLVEAFATVREASKRVLKMRHFDVQMIGGIILHQGMIIEMGTGEGKTLIATLPAYLNALAGQGVHIVTVNDYLVERDAAWMGKIYNFLGCSVGCIVHDVDDEARRDAYHADITYVTNNELGFDYLRDNMKFRLEQMAQRSFSYAIVDEVDSILIDEARTPLIISGPAEDSSELYKQVNQIIPSLTEEDYEKDEKSRSITLTDKGSQRVEELLEKLNLIQGGSLYDIHNISLIHHVNQALKAHKLFSRDVDYMVKGDKVMIIDEFTGRIMEGRRYSDGLHQALEAKENVTIQMENQTLASITFQNLFRIYHKLSGMTGTAKTEAAELHDIYNLNVVQVPTNLPLARQDLDDEVYRTAEEKYEAIIHLIQESQAKKQPVLVGTVSIEKSEHLSALLTKHYIPHQVLNARYHEQEAHIISQAGRPGAVTIATNMAGRGTDIKLGGNLEMSLAAALANITKPEDRLKIEEQITFEIKKAEAEVKAAGGLMVIGTERHESRRIDNQLRGRSGRQGDPGKTKFFLSLDDDLMRIFGTNRLDPMLQKLGLKHGEAITHPWINKALKRAQKKVEDRNYDIRKQVIKFDDVTNAQRKVIYEQRREFMTIENAHDLVLEIQEEIIENCLIRHIPEGTYSDQWDIQGLHESCLRIFGLNLPFESWSKEEGIAEVEIKQRLAEAIEKKMAAKENQYGFLKMREAEKSILLRLFDQRWKDHLHALDYVRQGINLRAYAQRDPLNEYKQEAFSLFQEMIMKVKEQLITSLCHVELHEESASEIFNAVISDLESNQKNMRFEHPDVNQGDENLDPLMLSQKTLHGSPNIFPGPVEKINVDIGLEQNIVSRNAPCPCGSGKRFKHCHG